MTPTLVGRWITRIMLYVLVALPVTFLYAFYIAGRNDVPALPFHIIDLMLMIGLLLDPLYILLQRLRWDQDWPFAFQLLAMTFEFSLAWYVIDAGWLSTGIGVFVVEPRVALWHFFWIVTASLAALLGGLQVLFIRWRFNGGNPNRMR